MSESKLHGACVMVVECTYIHMHKLDALTCLAEAMPVLVGASARLHARACQRVHVCSCPTCCRRVCMHAHVSAYTFACTRMSARTRVQLTVHAQALYSQCLSCFVCCRYQPIWLCVSARACLPACKLAGKLHLSACAS